MEIFAPFFLCVIFLAAMYGLMRLALYLNRLFAKRSVYKSGIYTAKTVHTLLLAQFGEGDLLSEAFFPRKTATEVVFEKCDHILFLNGTIAIVTVCREEGKINNLSFGETWYTRVHTKTGAERELTFENPITAGERKVQTLAKILENAKFRTKIPIEHIIIFPSRRVRFLLPRQKEIMSPPEALRKLLEMNQTVRFSKEQKKAIGKAVKQSSFSQAQVEKIQAKKRKAKAPKPIPKAKANSNQPKKQTASVNKSTLAVHPTVKYTNPRTPQTKKSPQTTQAPIRKPPAPYSPQKTKQPPTFATKNTTRRHR